ncbi:unnamed protein product [Protopolystoma xenopodis]|uniref:Uncharacterized protein n=1 Tax=Protopolystoma xenopodis TaxID=117903 RepID=A0A448WTW1_9PLAT|nr:unnamed protein product [Protopolystoma xenopodis]
MGEHKRRKTQLKRSDFGNLHRRFSCSPEWNVTASYGSTTFRASMASLRPFDSFLAPVFSTNQMNLFLRL